MSQVKTVNCDCGRLVALNPNVRVSWCPCLMGYDSLTGEVRVPRVDATAVDRPVFTLEVE